MFVPIIVRRIIFLAIILFIAYGIYWLVDRKGADDLKDNIITNTQETIDNIKKDTASPESLDDELTMILESFEDQIDREDIVVEQNIVIEDPEISEPELVVEEKEEETTTKTKTSKSTTSSSNILFQLFK